jgi:lipopolysaccharide/colanic/teichoic acid biosynthesis glycosyltransferase
MKYQVVKRVIDIFLSSVILIICLPIILVIVLLLCLTGEREVFYLQSRVGYRNRRFKIWKFATMLKNSPNMGTGSLTLRNDARVTTVGRFLRKSKLNELPQIFNVLAGDMSLVGPRPQMEVDFMAFPEHIRPHIYNVKPGITGIGSIIFRDEEKIISQYPGAPREVYDNVIGPYKGEVEMWYQKNYTLITDVLIVILTVWIVIFPASRAYERIFPTLPKAPALLRV